MRRAAGWIRSEAGMERAWRVKRSEVVVKDRWIDVRADHCVSPTGVEISPYYVLSYPDWVHVVAITGSGGVVLVRQYRHAAGVVTLELPGGGVDGSDAMLEAAAARELEEETGFTASRWELITSLYPNAATHTNRVHFFLAVDAVRTGSQSLDPGEAGLTVEVLPIPMVVDGLRSGLLGSAAHASGLLLGLAMAGRLDLGVR
jgi:8-oxo-dGTP pyrophosphatase MutT (NUDIX family)